MIGKTYLQHAIILFVLFNLAFTQSEDKNLNARLKTIVKQLQSSNAQLRFSALAELEKLGTATKAIRPNLEKALNQANGRSKLAIMHAIGIIDQLKNKKDSDQYITKKIATKRSLASRVSKNLGGLNILGVSNDFRQRLRYGKRHALVIGINKYNKYYPELDGPN
ncbi:hypothetical protein, partial [Candidatus Uabimicrobium amorphum]